MVEVTCPQCSKTREVVRARAQLCISCSSVNRTKNNWFKRVCIDCNDIKLYPNKLMAEKSLRCATCYQKDRANKALYSNYRTCEKCGCETRNASLSASQLTMCQPCRKPIAEPKKPRKKKNNYPKNRKKVSTPSKGRQVSKEAIEKAKRDNREHKEAIKQMIWLQSFLRQIKLPK